MYKGSDLIALNQLRAQTSDLGPIRPGQDPAVLHLRHKVLIIWKGMSPQQQLQQAMQIPNGIASGPIVQTQAPGGPISIGPGNHAAPSDLNAFLGDVEKIAGVSQLNQMNMRGTLVRNPLFSWNMIAY